MKNNLLRIFFVLLIFSSFSIGQNNYDAQISKGLNLAYNFQLDEAEKVFSKAMEISPDRPEAYHYNAQMHLWAFLGTKDKTEMKIFILWSDLSVSKAETLLKKSKGDVKLNYLLGNIYLLKAMAYGADNSNLSAFSASKNSFSYFEKTLELKPGYYDAYRGLGLFHYAMDFIPGIFKWAVSISGIKPDRERGFNYVRTAYRKGTDDRIESGFHLAKIYTDYTGEYDSAFAVLKPLLNQFPGNPVFNYQAAVILLKNSQLTESEKYLNKVISQKHPSVKHMNCLALFLKGDIYFKRNDFTNAEKYYNDFIENAKDADYTGIANLRLAICRFINGKKDLYKRALLDAVNGNSDIFEDEYAKRISKEINGRELTNEEISIVKAHNDYDNQKYQNVIQQLSSSVSSFKKNDIKVQAFLLLAEASNQLKKTDDALKYLSTFDSIKPDEAKWVIPRSLYLKALIEFKKGDLKHARELYDNAVDENDYDFKDEIAVLLNNLKQRIFKNE